MIICAIVFGNIQAQCDDGWKELGEFCYKIDFRKVSFQRAKNECQDANLVSINNKMENDIVLSLIRGNFGFGMGYYLFWIGGQIKTDQNHTGKAGRSDNWEWTDGTAWNYSDWEEEEPNNYENDERCLSIEVSGTWFDRPCSNEYGFICKKAKKNLRLTTKVSVPLQTTVNPEDERPEEAIQDWLPLILSILIVTLIIAGLTLLNSITIVYILTVKYRKQPVTTSRQSEAASSSADPSDPACTLRSDGRPKRREDLMYQNNEDTGEEYYSRADSRYNSVEYNE